MLPGAARIEEVHPDAGVDRELDVLSHFQVFQVTRKTRDRGTRRWRTVTVYAITSLSHAQASPARLADLIRGHRTMRTACTGSGM
jgi:hypothetical protein